MSETGAAGVVSARAGAPVGAVVARWAVPAVVVGALFFTAACPPYEYWLLGWVTPALFLLPVGRLTPRRAALAGALFGTVWGCTMAGWMRAASLAYFDFNGAMAVGFVVVVSVLYAGVPNALLAGTWALTADRIPNTARGLLAGWLWAASEVLRTHVFTGLPWELLGHTQYRVLPIIQIADLGGAYAVSFVMACVSVSVADALTTWRSGSASRDDGARRLLPATAILAASLAYGAWCQRTYDHEPAVDAPVVAVVQGNVPNELRWKREHFERTLLTYAALTNRTAGARPDVVVWPENAVNFYIEREPMLRPVLASAAATTRQGLIVGGPRLDDEGRSYNAAYLLDPRGMVRWSYDKRRLLPFAEYNPFRGGAAQPLAGPIEFTAGAEPSLLATGRLRLGTLICYEMLFPALVRDLVRRGADVLVNISNDSWLDQGDGTAPRQHFSMVVFSAVAARRHLVRASASGVSGFVTPYGTVHGRVPRATEGVATGRVESRTGLSPYMRWGDGWLGAMLLPLVIVGRRRRARRPS